MSSPTECESTAPATSIPLAFVTAMTAALPISLAAPFIMTCLNKNNESLLLNQTNKTYCRWLLGDLDIALRWLY